MYIHLGEPTHTPAPPKGIVLPPPPPPVSAPAPAQGAQPLRLPSARLTRVPDTRLAPFASICRIVARTAKSGVSYGTGILIGLSRSRAPTGSFPQDQLTKDHRLPARTVGPPLSRKSDGWAVSPAYRGNNRTQRVRIWHHRLRA
jgi:hypothetical protein